MKKILICLAMCISLMGLIGCGTVGKDFNETQVNQIVNGQTTREDILSMFGQPFKKGIYNGRPIWVYEYNYYHSLGDDTSKDLIITFDSNDVVKTHQLMANYPLNQ